ncbi:aminotransferase class V-fold PLP-dependent enzyme [Porphyromonadaceae bacterium W3.11]|nr:aminotransferase class V-fold PLP-dependent enzyme [Porphyromonadaceae bacterium W3.11]
MLTPEETIYLDNASTSYPKPVEVIHTLSHFYDHTIGSYGRSGDPHTIQTSGIIEDLRDLLATMIGADRLGSHIIFTHNATDGINRVLNGLPPLQADEVVISPMEHNAVTRPLYAKLQAKAPLTMPHHKDGMVDLHLLEELLTNHPKSTPLRLAILNGMSNVNGVIQPMAHIIQLLRDFAPRCQILLDASQAFPYIPPLSTLPDFIAITGHKGSLGPTGTGALFIAHPDALTPVVRGGNGYRSELQEISPFMPDRFEAGTMNLLGLVAWYAALSKPHPSLITKEMWQEHITRVRSISGINVFSASSPECQGPVYSICSEKYPPSQLGDLLLLQYRISSRSGLHCAPLAHKTIGTMPLGTTRISISALTPPEYLDQLYSALYELHR